MRSSKPRKIANFSDSSIRRLNAYALSATAAGVGMLALAMPAEAKIVYTPAHVKIFREGYFLDLTNDGTHDFSILSGSSARTTSSIRYMGINVGGWGKGHLVAVAAGTDFADALRPGARIRGSLFPNSSSNNAEMAQVKQNGHKGTSTFRGPWADNGKGVKNRYLGLKFKINGKFHYGWARFNLTLPPKQKLELTLTGYAYETIPNKPIIAGKTKGPDVIAVQPATLGHLAQGASAISDWRVK
jgi:hypothetical protein